MTPDQLLVPLEEIRAVLEWIRAQPPDSPYRGGALTTGIAARSMEGMATTFTARVERGELSYIARTAEMRGPYACGKTPEEAVRKLRDAIAGWLNTTPESVSVDWPDARTFAASPSESSSTR